MELGPTLIVLFYLSVTFAIGVWGYRVTAKTAEDYFLANRTMGTLVFFFTMVATHLSGFAVFGLSGMAYRTGFAAYQFTFLANVSVPLVLYFVGYRIWRLGRERGYVSPTEFFVDRFQSQGLKSVILGIWFIFSLPFLAIQWTAGGYILSGLSDGAITFTAGAIFLMAFTIAYVFLGGMRGVAWTDTFQGILMFFFFTISGVVVVHSLGGLEASLDRIYQFNPDLLSRPGENGMVTVPWATGMYLVGLSALMAPQLFVRFYIPKSTQQFKILSVIWIPTVSWLMFVSVLVGVLGRTAIPDLTGAESDRIFAEMLSRYAPTLLNAAFSGGVLAALMSTASSVILVLSTLFTRDIYFAHIRRQASDQNQVRAGRLCILAIGLASCTMALWSESTIFGLLLYAWSAFAMILPATVAGLFWSRANAWGCLSGILAGMVIITGEGNFILENWAFGYPAIVPAMALNVTLLLLVSWLTSGREKDQHPASQQA